VAIGHKHLQFEIWILLTRWHLSLSIPGFGTKMRGFYQTLSLLRAPVKEFEMTFSSK
jgi:hypothetical protein